MREKKLSISLSLSPVSFHPPFLRVAGTESLNVSSGKKLQWRSRSSALQSSMAQELWRSLLILPVFSPLFFSSSVLNHLVRTFRLTSNYALHCSSFQLPFFIFYLVILSDEDFFYSFFSLKTPVPDDHKNLISFYIIG